MSDIPPINITYGDFLKNIKTSFNEDLLLLPTVVMGFSYEGFSPENTFKQFIKCAIDKNLTYSDISKDLTRLLGLFHVRGPNVIKITIDNTKGGKSAVDSITTLKDRYSLKANKPKGNDITLPRLSMVFAIPSYQVYETLKSSLTSYPVTEAELGISGSQDLFPNYIPCLISIMDLKDNKIGLALFIHNLYQMSLSVKTQNPKTNKKDISEFWEPSVKYTSLAINGSLTSNESKKAFSISLGNLITSINIDEVAKCASRIFSINPTIICEELTKYHKLINSCIRTGKAVSTIPIDEWNL